MTGKLFTTYEQAKDVTVEGFDDVPPMHGRPHAIAPVTASLHYRWGEQGSSVMIHVDGLRRLEDKRLGRPACISFLWISDSAVPTDAPEWLRSLAIEHAPPGCNLTANSAPDDQPTDAKR